MKPVTQVSHEGMQRLLDEGEQTVCLVTMNDNFGLRLIAINFVFDNGNAVVIDIPTTSAPKKLKELLKGLKIGDAIFYEERRIGRALITPLFPSDQASQQELRSAREEFLPQIYAH